MKKFFLLGVVLTLAGCSLTPQTSTNSTTTPTLLTVYTYDSLDDPDYGLLPKVIPEFESTNAVSVKVVTFPDTGAMINQLLAEKNAPQADVVMGIDNSDVARFSDQNIFSNPTPFDYSYVDFVYDTTQLSFPTPIHLTDLTDPKYKGKIIIEQPGLSSPGTQLLLWTHAVLGETGAADFWTALAKNDPIITSDWNTAYYTDFLGGQAPIVLSYITSPAYHIDQEQSHQYAAIPIADGYLQQTEEVAIVTGSQNTTLGQQFITYLTTDAVQDEIPRTQWMIPVAGDSATLPAAYTEIIQPTAEQTVALKNDNIKLNFTNWLQSWNSAFGIQ